MDIQIDKGIPIPPPQTRRGRSFGEKRRLPFASMEIGDSFFWPTTDPISVCRDMLSAAPRVGKRVTTRRVDGGIRVWRIA